MALTITRLNRCNIGDRILVVVSALSGAGGETSITAAEVGLQRIDSAWTQSVDEAAAPIAISDYSGTSITFGALTNGDTSLFFLIGY